MVNVRRSLCVMFASTRPLYCICDVFVGFTELKKAMSGIPSSPPPTPGMLGFPPYVRSCMPSPVWSGEPTSSPPVIVLQFSPSVRPIEAHVRGIMPFDDTAFPGKDRNLDAMLPAVAAD